MACRYQQLRHGLILLAKSADEQHAYLMNLLGHAVYGNDELALEFGDIYCATGHMLEWKEVTQEEIDAAKPLDTMLKKLSGKKHADFWQREALWSDPRWEEVRKCAQMALLSFPDEERPSHWLDSLN